MRVLLFSVQAVPIAGLYICSRGKGAPSFRSSATFGWVGFLVGLMGCSQAHRPILVLSYRLDSHCLFVDGPSLSHHLAT